MVILYIGILYVKMGQSRELAPRLVFTATELKNWWVDLGGWDQMFLRSYSSLDPMTGEYKYDLYEVDTSKPVR
jgi:hypothetical protein